MKTMDIVKPAADATMLRGLKRLRKAAGMSQEQAAQALGVSRQAYSSWELCQGEPLAGNLIAIMRLFGCSADELLEEGDDVPDEKGSG